MPHFTSRVSDLPSIGPIVDIVLLPGREALAAGVIGKDGQVPSEKIAALIDTGASHTVIKQGTCEKLGLQPIGVQYINTPSSTNVECFQYSVQFLFPHDVVVGSVVTEAPLKNQPIQALIGRDILTHGILVYIGPDNSFTLSF